MQTAAIQSNKSSVTFDAEKYKETTRQQWQAAAAAWNTWGPLLRAWLGPCTETMLDMATIGLGSSVLDVAAGAGDQTLQIAARVGPSGHVLATDISSAILEFAAENARRAGYRNVDVRMLDGEQLDVKLALTENGQNPTRRHVRCGSTSSVAARSYLRQM
jgi:cyclopropane fatty-acyl-phospholipid synthase-like methyltransferase